MAALEQAAYKLDAYSKKLGNYFYFCFDHLRFVSVWPERIYVHHVHEVPVEARRGHLVPWIGVTKLPCRCSELNLCPQQEHKEYLASHGVSQVLRKLSQKGCKFIFR